MTDQAIYRYQHQFVTLSKERVEQVFSDQEKSLRTGNFTYRKTVLTKKQYEEMKRDWTPEAMEYFKQNAQKIAGDAKVTPEIAYKAAVNTVMEFVLKSRVDNAAIRLSEEPLRRTISLDIALSTMMDVAFDTSCTTGTSKIIAGKKIETRYTLLAEKFSIDCDEASNADLFVFSIYIEQLNKSILIGWKNQKEIRVFKRGNKKTDPDNCNWKNMSFYFTYPELNPMSDLATQFGLKELPEDTLFEQMTQLHYIPIADSAITRTLMHQPKKSNNYYKDLGLEDPVSPEKEKDVVTQEDEWTM